MKKMLFLLVLMWNIFGVAGCVWGTELTPGDPEYYDFSDIDSLLEQSGTSYSFGDAFRAFVSGDTELGYDVITKKIFELLFGELEGQKQLIFKIITIGIGAALITNLSKSFLSGAVSELGFYITFILLMCTLTAGYALVAKLVTDALNLIIELMNAVVPAYIISLGFSTGQSSAMAFYQIIAMIILIIEQILKNFILPMIYIYMMTSFINNISPSGYLTKACELIKTVINWIMKTLMAFVVGMNIIRSLINPVVDSIKTSALGKAAAMIPGVGGVISSVSGIVLGSGTIIKNSMGVASMLAIIAVAFTPVVKTIAISLGYKLTGVILEPVSDKRIINAISGLHESIVMLAKVLLYGVSFFILTMAIICNATNMSVG